MSAAGVTFLSAWSAPLLRGVVFLVARECEGHVAGGVVFYCLSENRPMQRAVGPQLWKMEGPEIQHRTDAGIGGSSASTQDADLLVGWVARSSPSASVLATSFGRGMSLGAAFDRLQLLHVQCAVGYDADSCGVAAKRVAKRSQQGSSCHLCLQRREASERLLQSHVRI